MDIQPFVVVENARFGDGTMSAVGQTLGAVGQEVGDFERVGAAPYGAVPAALDPGCGGGPVDDVGWLAVSCNVREQVLP